MQQIVERCLQCAGLSGRGYSPHKLRHTAATLMYQNGVDMLALKEILGHENVSTTQIYTHINQKQLHDAVEASPLSRSAIRRRKRTIYSRTPAKKTADPPPAAHTAAPRTSAVK